MSKSVFHLVVSGSRHFSNKDLVFSHLSSALSRQPNLVVICGGGKGADQLASQWACQNRVPLLIAPAHWSSCGKSAGPKRNQFMLSLANGLLAFPLPNSRGTVSVIAQAKMLGIPTKVIL